MIIFRKKYIFTTLIAFIFLIILLKILSRPNYTRTCNQTGEFQEKLHELTDRAHYVLDLLNLTHFICYGSLWGQIRLSRLLPWEDKSVMCLLNEEVKKLDEVYFMRTFKKHGIHIYYEPSEGQFVAKNISGNNKMRVLLVLFEYHNVIHKYRRIGWMFRLLPPDCEMLDYLDCFPERLISYPLPKKEFGKNLIPVPREGIEIQKYHFKNNWWKEIPAKNC